MNRGFLLCGAPRCATEGTVLTVGGNSGNVKMEPQGLAQTQLEYKTVDAPKQTVAVLYLSVWLLLWKIPRPYIYIYLHGCSLQYSQLCRHEKYSTVTPCDRATTKLIYYMYTYYNSVTSLCVIDHLQPYYAVTYHWYFSLYLIIRFLCWHRLRNFIKVNVQTSKKERWL